MWGQISCAYILQDGSHAMPTVCKGLFSSVLKLARGGFIPQGQLSQEACVRDGAHSAHPLDINMSPEAVQNRDIHLAFGGNRPLLLPSNGSPE